MADFSSINAPQFFDFSKGDEDDEIDNIESYFEVNHNNDTKYVEVDEISDPTEKRCLMNFRKSLSVGNLPLLCSQGNENTSTISSRVSSEPVKKTKLSRSKYASTEQLHQTNKFVSMAEMVNKFQNDTPERFRRRAPSCPKNVGQQKPTIAQSPHLATKNRARPLSVLSQEERENKEMEEARKFKIKANPVNKRVLQGPMKPTIPVEKSVTVLQPFNLTSVPQKRPPTPNTKVEYKFQAKPVPKSVTEPPKVIQKPGLHTNPVTPELMKHISKQNPEKAPVKPSPKPFIPTKTIPVPFSFEKRDQAVIKKKEQFIKRILEEEKQAREFHANPLPKFIATAKSASSGSLSKHNSSDTDSVKSCGSEGKGSEFKARPPIVLYKEPFIPKKSERPLTEVIPFNLNSNRRAEEYKEFEERIKKREEQIAMYKREKELERCRFEQEEINILRKQAEFKAQPVMQYKPLVIVPSNKVTDPQSPRLSNKENIGRKDKLAS